RLDRLWKTVLLNQFHDILPGSSIAWVHREAEATYAAVRVELEEVIAAATAALCTAPTVFNTAPRPRAEVAVAPAGITAGGGQALADGSTAVFVEVPASGVAQLGLAGLGDAAAAPVAVTVTGDR